MAMVLEAFASYIDDLLKQVEEEELAMLLGVSGGIDKLGDKLRDLKDFHADADRRSIIDDSVQMWVTELKRAMYDATDILDTCQLNAMEQGKSVVQGDGCFNPLLLLCMRNPDYAHCIGSRIKALNQKLDALMARSGAFGFIRLESYEDRGSKVPASRLAAVQETSWKLDRSAVVGEKIQEDTKALVETMLKRTEGETSRADNNVAVFAVVGVGGSGKTTLAQKVFNSEAIQWEFDKKIWLSLDRNVNEVEMLKRAITEAGGNHRAAGNLVIALHHILQDAIKGKKLFLVMDDVWDGIAWDCMLKMPIVNAAASGSRVLITTRSVTVAREMRAVRMHHVYTLEPEDAWTLLKRQVISSEIDEVELRDIGLQIIEKCDGLPLSVKLMGGLLCQRESRRRDWEMVLNDSIWSMSQIPVQLNCAIFLSYEDLSPGLKQCFLHYSLLPKSGKFNNDDVVGMWISEGFLHGNSDELEELGNKYYKELISRKLIEPDLEYRDQRVCNMHDIVRSFAHFVSRYEAVETGSFSGLISQGFFQLFLECEGLQWSRLQAYKSLRTLISVGHMKIQTDDSLISFPCLRTLHIKYANSAILIKSLYQLKHLRYLAIIHQTYVSKLPENIGRMKFLQHINLLGCESLVKLPNSIVKLGQLRYLNLNGTSINGIPRGFSCLINLRNLFGFPTHTDGEWCSLEELGPLCHLRALGLEGLKNVCAASSAAKAQLGEKVNLNELNLRCNNISEDDELVKELEGISEERLQQIKEVFDELCPPSCLVYLCIRGYFGRSLPMWMMSNSEATLKSLRTLILNDLACCTQLPDGLCQLPCLQFMLITSAPAIKRIGPEFVQVYRHRSFHPSQLEVAFPRLNKLVLNEMKEWEKWEWQEQVQAMPILEELHLNGCKLRHVPPGLPSQAKALKRLFIGAARSLGSLESFASLVELDVCYCPKLTCISDLARLQNLTVSICPKLKILIGVPALRRLLLEDYDMRTLPEYMGGIRPPHLLLDCSLELLTSIAAGRSGSEWHKFCHIHNVKAYAHDGDNRRKWYVRYTADPYILETNITHPSLLAVAIGKGKDEFVGSNEHELADTDRSRTDSEVSVREDYDEIVATDNPSTSAAHSKDDGEIVGIDGVCKDLIKVLTHSKEKQLKKVSICGVGGLGKTTIAREVYRQIENEFDCQAFVTVSHNHVDDIIRSISDQVNCPCPGFEECGIKSLFDGLTLFLRDRRYMIVLDDISAIRVLDLIMPALSGNNHGSKLIVTTRNIDVAGYIGGIYVPPLLSYHCSKKLFYTRTIFGSEDHCPSQFIELSKRMLRKCSGLPLAIIAVTNLLPSRIALEDWQKVSDSIEFGDGLEGMRGVLLSCYDELPPRLKNCLLYLSIFPEDYKIRKDCLVQRWIAEDLICADHGQNLQELGEGYFCELINTGMVRAVEFDGCGEAVACCVPVSVLQLIAHLSIERKFVAILPRHQQTDLQDKVQRNSKKKDKVQRNGKKRDKVRLSLQISSEQHDVLKATKTVGQVSSLSIFSGADLVQPLSKFRGLRLLDLEKCDSVKNEHLNRLGNLVKLRYLVLGSSHITKIPQKIAKLRNLHTLDLTGTRVKEVPCSIVKLTQLRRLLINSSTEVPDGIIGKLQALEELVHVDISKSPSIMEDISTLPEMRVLSLALWSWDERHSTLLTEGLRKLTTKKLKQLSIFSCCLLDFKSDLQPVLRQLEKLEIQGSIFDTLPKWIDQLAHLRSLSVEVYTLKNDDLRILGKLSHLLFLSLAAKRSLGEKLVVGRNEISSLKTFHLCNRSMAIKFEQGAMERLQRLKLTLQASLTENFSFGLENLSSLKHVEVEIICFSATDDSVKVAEAAITSKIRDNPSEPTLEITRTEEKYMTEDKKREAGCEIKIEDQDQEALCAAKAEQSVPTKKKSRRARKKNKRKH